MIQPYQCLEVCGKVLIAARISCLDSFNIEDGSLLSSWNNSTLSSRNPSQETASGIQQDLAKGPTLESCTPSKRRRLSTPGEEGKCTANKEKNLASNESKSAKGTPVIIALTSTSDEKHLIAVTGEDKTIRVFEHDGKGRLQQLSQRAMPKRPCALAVTTDNSTIICADKFGDVYSLPLLYTVSPGNKDLHDGQSKSIVPPETQSRPFIPAANNLTVHSVRNLRALNSQMKQAQNAPRKVEPEFKRKLLLGHVSMLTDIALVECEGRSYIVTADRDEHIRISRGIPQAHIIERYCLGHKDFVSRLCIPASRQNVLISGGGDDDLYVWNWYVAERVQSISLRGHVEKFLTSTAQNAVENGKLERADSAQLDEGKIAVSKIIYLGSNVDTIDDIVVVTCEGIPALFVFALLQDSTLRYHKSLPLKGNPLDVIASASANSIIVSIDYLHEPGSTTQRRTFLDKSAHLLQLQLFQITDSGLASAPLQFKPAHETAAAREHDEPDIQDVSNMLYNIANLRKRGGED